MGQLFLKYRNHLHGQFLPVTSSLCSIILFSRPDIRKDYFSSTQEGIINANTQIYLYFYNSNFSYLHFVQALHHYSNMCICVCV